MKPSLIMIAVFLTLCALGNALNVPVSAQPVITDANLLTGMQRVTPDDKAPETLSTKSWLWQDGEELVVYAECEIDSTFKVGTLSTRDGGVEADYFRVQLITVPDAYYAYYYFAYPLGNLRDGVRSSTSADPNWNSHYSYTTEYDTRQWRITLRIPLAELRFKQKLPYQWKIILTRGLLEAGETYSLPYLTTQMQNDYYTKAQDITLSLKVKRSLDLKFKPYLVKSYDLIHKTASFDPDNLGLDIAFNPTQQIRIKASVNPDYSDVPPDNAADTYNSKYPPMFAENRFFFTEDIDALGVGSSTFYTRNIVQPSFAFKATGTTGKLNWGALAAKDQKISLYGMTINPDDYYQVLALIPSWKKLRLSNALITRANTDYYNHTYRGNYRWNFAKDLTLTAGLNASLRKDDRQGEADQTDGYLATAQLNAFPGDWSMFATYTRVSPDYSPDAGYFWETDYQSVDASVSWDIEAAKGYIESQGATAYWSAAEYLSKEIWVSGGSASYYVYFRPDYDFDLGVFTGKELDDLDRSHDILEVNFQAGFTRWDALQIKTQIGGYRNLIYDLLETHDMLKLRLDAGGSLSQNLVYSLGGEWKDYDYPKLNTVIVDADTTIVRLDDRYAIFNGALAYTPRAKLRLSAGVGISGYETATRTANLTGYGSLRYEFRPECFLFMGFTTRQDQTSRSTLSDPLGQFRKNTASVYAKLALTL